MKEIVRYLLSGVLLLCLAGSVWAAAAPVKVLRVHYHRVQNDYMGWGLHVWGDGIRLPRSVRWDDPLRPSGVSEHGIYFDIPVTDARRKVYLLLHKDDVRQAAGESAVIPAEDGANVWFVQDEARIYTRLPAHLDRPRRATQTTINALKNSLTVESNERERTEARLRQEYEYKLRLAAEEEYQLALKRIQLEAQEKARNDLADRNAARNEDHGELAGDVPLDNAYAWWLLGFLSLTWLGLSIWQQLRIGRLYQELRAGESASVSLKSRLEDATSDQEHARQQMMTLERRLNTVFTQAADAMVVISVELGDSFRIVAINKAFSTHTGLLEADLLGKRVDEVFGVAAEQGEIMRRLREVARRCEPVQFDERIEFPKGVLSLDTQLSPIQAQPGFCSHILFSARVRQENRNLRERWQHYAHFDALTGLANRSQLHQKLGQQLQRMQRQRGSALAVIILNLDKFRQLNDRFGFETGDAILQTVSQRIQGCVRDTDTVARLGADEFAVLLSDGSNGSIAQHVAEKILSVLQRPLPLEGELIRLAASLGVAVYPDDGNNANLLLKHADMALRKAKQQGGNASILYSARFNELGLERLALETSLRNSIAQQQFHFLYQPVFSGETGNVVAIEALLRWQHPDFGIVLPNQFLSMAESLGLMPAILEWGLKTLSHDLPRLWQKRPAVDCALNISIGQFYHAEFLHIIDKVLSESILDPSRIVFDVAEATLQADVARAGKLIDQLRERGIRVAVDDFGSGYTALTALKRFPLADIKLERGLVSQMSRDGDSSATVQSIILQARTLNLKVTAKGIEHASERMLLVESGCDYLQGFCLSTPIDLDALIEQNLSLNGVNSGAA